MDRTAAFLDCLRRGEPIEAPVALVVAHPEPPSPGWKTFLHNHADGIAAMDLFVVPTISFRLLVALLIKGGTADDKFCRLASQLTPLQNGSQIRSRKHAVGNRFPLPDP